ncbi:PREDICTED: proto-oncogene tyrosine-protein kinase ROS [Ceratosolen solmsi marchali]|uniref:Tyrosine-protein kinase receptor n=1 Tax=Ceratosolen solmsi marchali TaxID=326594 RepID=A0AAJ6VLE4_9HYME|nr:PREDICTED: proto-oncogene tyrosine-protein kinase ROS [Ceratosolen solmsi marchali]
MEIFELHRRSLNSPSANSSYAGCNKCFTYNSPLTPSPNDVSITIATTTATTISCPVLEALLAKEDDTDDVGAEVGCTTQCEVDHCSDGCIIWERALNSSCQEVCNVTQGLLSLKELYCTVGCQSALSRYFQQLKVHIGVPPTPILVNNSLAATSLTLQWDNTILKHYNFKIAYFMQWKYEESRDDWQYCNKQNWNGKNQIFIRNLQPYTRYKFRLAILLKLIQRDDEPIFSQSSLSILTLAGGSPTSAPTIVQASAIDHSRVYVSWEAGSITNGPLFSYVLRLQQEGHEIFQLKHIPVSQDTFMFQNLQANTNYSVTLNMKNDDGEGPETYTFVKTLVEPEVNSSEKPELIISSEYSIVLQSADVLVETRILYEDKERIRESALLIADSRLFVCDMADRLHSVSFDEAIPVRSLLLHPNITYLRPWSLSVDWLNGILYLAGASDRTGFWEIARSDLEGRNLTSLVGELIDQPRSLRVDPVNGFIFWMASDGIYRADLADFDDNVEVQVEQILKKSNLGAFVVDYINRRLLVTYQSENTIKSVSLDGKVAIDIRINTKQPKFKNVISLTMTNGLFYWTNGIEVIAESYESNNFRYFHNVLFNRLDENFVRIEALMEECQPTPVPTEPPRLPQALALTDRARISWQSPATLLGQGRGAWSSWFYALHVEDDVSGEVFQEKAVTGLEHLVGGLREGALYTARIAGHSQAGSGPWSANFKIQTIKKESKSSILWTSNETIYKSDLIGENVKALVNITSLDEGNSFIISDICWYEDLLFLVGNNSKLYQYNTTSQRNIIVKFAHAISNVAVEWITKKLYWSDAKKQAILRSNMDGSLQEPIAIVGMTRTLLLDCLEATLYWSTSRTVEVARLNGEERRHYRSEDDFDGRHVVGLTLDLDNRFVYWIVGDYTDDYMLYRALTVDMLPPDSNIVPEMVSRIRRIVSDSLSYVSHRLVLLATPTSASFTSVRGKYASILRHFDIRSNISGLAVTAPIPPLHPKATGRIIVRPQPVNVSSIAISGTWRDFNITWQRVNNTSYGRVFYEVAFTDYINVDMQPITTSRNSMSYANADRLLPYTLLEVTIRAYTYWDRAARVTKVLRSPQSVPSQPVNPKIFVESYKDPLTEHLDHFITFRWNMPEFVNGPLIGFTVQCWFLVDNTEVSLCDSVNVPIHELEYTIHSLQPNTTYFFQVCAYAEVGAGLYTDPISSSTENENPIPQLLVATMEDVKKVDLDQCTNLTITRHIAVEVAVLATESKIYWINEMQELVTADVDGRNITKILTLNNTALSLCADWISRNLFWTESNYEDSGISHIMKLDITVWEAGVLKFSRILSRSRRIVNLDIAPLTGTLFWMELSTSNLGYVMQSDLYGRNVQPFFNHTEDCSCPFRPTILPVFTIDNSDPQSPVIYWMSAEDQLYIADIDGCICNLVLNPDKDRGLPPTSLTTDKNNIYWSNMNTGKIHFIDKLTSPEDIHIKGYKLSDVRSIKAIGKSLQPYPDSDCLMPQRAAYSVQEVSKTSSSIVIRLPEPAAYLGCEKYNLPATLYSLDIAQCKTIMENRHDDDACESDGSVKYQTYWKEFEVKNLKPYSEYRFKLTLANYYGDQEFTNVDQYGPGMILKTGAGIPSEPTNLNVQSLTPTLAVINWIPPQMWNADFLRYKVFWRSTKAANGVKSMSERSIKDGEVSVLLEALQPGQEYLVYVRAYPENFTDLYSQSEEKVLRMYPEPNNLTVSGVTPEALNVSWSPMNDLLIDYDLEFTANGLDNWETVSQCILENDRLIFQITNLKPNEYYQFKLILRYRNYTKDFLWPNDGRFTFQTLEDIPSAPGTPSLINLQTSNYQLHWEPATSLGYQVLSYFLEGMAIGPSTEPPTHHNVTNKWNTLYNGTDNLWNIQQDMHEKYLFRVRAKNDYGFGNWSENSSIVDLTEMTRAMIIAREHLGLILGLSIPVVTIVLLCFCYCLCPFQKKAKEDQKKIPIKTKPHVELATLREIPRGNFVETNALYVAAVETDSDDSLLPKIQREQISLAKFLGSGAFGEVFQGVAKDIDGPGSKIPIAVKTLRKGASAQEKSEFLQEAKLMSHFQHKHVLRLLGVCLDTDPPLLLLELMAGGDLLSYLRTSRSLKPTDAAALRLQDLLSMCEDVAQGCRYLEELHFVHRDLACRNCLVSAREREHRVVKIGDFGLARDIYKNDYYRKEGEGLLPVRWMAPESLVDGVFTSQSDVWAFGVLMWEITSLGQQPYQARTNLEVLHHVRAGGRLPKPLNCPARLHQLMLNCWSAVDSRPSFKLCLEHIVALRNNTDDSTLSPVNPGQFLVHGNIYKSNHFKDNLSIRSLIQDSDNSKPNLGPKYSWLLDNALEADEMKNPRAAYEIPKSIPVLLENTAHNESRYIEICGNEQNKEKELTIMPTVGCYNDLNSTITQSEMLDENPRWNRTSVTSLNLLEKKNDKTNATDKRSSTASLGEKFKSAEAIKQSGSYARLVGNGESVSSLSDWRRVKKIVGDEREKLNVERNNSDEIKSNDSSGTSPSICYSMVTFSQTVAEQRFAPTNNNDANKAIFTKLQRSKSNLQNSKANIPLVINSALLNLLRQAPDVEDENDDVTYANINSDIVNVTDL